MKLISFRKLAGFTGLIATLGLSGCDLFGGGKSGDSACTDGTSAQVAQGTFQESDSTVAQIVRDVPQKVIYATYQDLAGKAAALQLAVTTLSQSTTNANLTAAQSAWRAARKPWEQSEGFLFGPVETRGIDPHIDSWPLDKTALNNVMASGATLTKSYVDNLDDNLKGFHTIEYLLFDTNATKQASQLTARQLEYLKAVTESFKASVDTLEQAWNPAKGNYVGVFQAAGTVGTVYTSRSQAMQELLNGMAGICDEVANGKITDPFDQKDRKLEESQFSNNSDSDFADNIRSVRNLYLGSYGAQNGTGVKHLLQKHDAALALRVEAEIDTAIASILAMQPDFGSAIFNASDKVEAARCAVQILQSSLEGPVKKVLGL